MLLVYLSKFFDVRVYADGVLRDIVGFLVDIPFGVLADDVSVLVSCLLLF